MQRLRQKLVLEYLVMGIILLGLAIIKVIVCRKFNCF